MKFLFLLALLVSTSVFADPLSAYQDLQDGKALFIDVRESDELKNGMIKGAISIPLSGMEANPTETNAKVAEASQGKAIYVYCKSGRRSGIFLTHMSKAGLTGVNLGGYADLLKAGLPSNLSTKLKK